MTKLQSIAVFCGSSNGVDPSYLNLASRLGGALAQADITMVYGGGHSGLMGAVAQGTMQAGGNVTGVIPGGLFTNGIEADDITTLEVVDDMHQRKARMYELSDGFIGLPGGLGTFEEIFEAATWTQLGLHAGSHPKPVVLLDEDGFWDGAHALLARSHQAGLLREKNRSIIQPAKTIAEAIALVEADLAHETPEFVTPPRNPGA